MVISEATSSHGLSGLTNRWPRLRDHISSRKQIENPIWPRNSTSHSSTPAISTPAASASQFEWLVKNWLISPHRIIWMVGQ